MTSTSEKAINSPKKKWGQTKFSTKMEICIEKLDKSIINQTNKFF